MTSSFLLMATRTELLARLTLSTRTGFGSRNDRHLFSFLRGELWTECINYSATNNEAVKFLDRTSITPQSLWEAAGSRKPATSSTCLSGCVVLRSEMNRTGTCWVNLISLMCVGRGGADESQILFTVLLLLSCFTCPCFILPLLSVFPFFSTHLLPFYSFSPCPPPTICPPPSPLCSKALSSLLHPPSSTSQPFFLGPAGVCWAIIS